MCLVGLARAELSQLSDLIRRRTTQLASFLSLNFKISSSLRSADNPERLLKSHDVVIFIASHGGQAATAAT